MTPRFSPCPSCSRHVKQGDNTCPFCDADVPHDAVPAVAVTAGRLSRASLFAAGAAGLVLVTNDCSSPPAPIPPYGAAPFFDAALGPSSGGLTDGGSSTPDTAGEDGPTDAGSERAVVPSSDGGGG
jgi:hypothetical protein